MANWSNIYTIYTYFADEVTDTQKADYDGEYASNVTLRGDFSILMETVLAVFTRCGVHDGK